MPVTPGPRTQTGLVPTSYKLQVNRLTSPKNWKALPPRPPPEKFPFRGDGIGKMKIHKTKRSPMRDIKAGIEKKYPNKKPQIRQSGNKSERELPANSATTSSSTKKKEKKKKKRQEWNDRNERELSVMSDSHYSDKKVVRGETLDYIRKSARRRSQIDELQKRLDDEITQENKFYGFDDDSYGLQQDYSSNDHDQSHDSSVSRCDCYGRDTMPCADKDDSETVLKESREIKCSMMKELDRLQTIFLERMERLEKDETDSEGNENPAPSTADKKIQHSSDNTNISQLGIEGANSSIAYLDDRSSKQFKSFDVPQDSDNFMKKKCETKNHIPLSSLPIDGSNEGAINMPSKDSAWEILSQDQLSRIQVRSQELYDTKYRSCMESNRHVNEYWEPLASDQKFGPEGVDEEQGAKDECSPVLLDPNKDSDSGKHACDQKEADFSLGLSENDSCIEDLVSAITTGLFSNKSSAGGENENQESKEEIRCHRDEHETPRENLPRIAPKPRHPYKLPLKVDIRETMIKESK